MIKCSTAGHGQFTQHLYIYIYIEQYLCICLLRFYTTVIRIKAMICLSISTGKMNCIVRA